MNLHHTISFYTLSLNYVHVKRKIQQSYWFFINFFSFIYTFTLHNLFSVQGQTFNYADIFANSLALLYNQHVKSQEAIEPKNKEGKTDKQKVAQSYVSLDIVQIVAGNGFLCTLNAFYRALCVYKVHTIYLFSFCSFAYLIISCNFFFTSYFVPSETFNW